MNVSIVSILICTYDRARLLRETLAAIQAMALPAGCAAEVLVVDNNSTDNTRAVVAESAAIGPMPVTYLRESSQGKSFALNCGLAHARGDVVALTDDDVLPAGDWLERIVSAFRQHDVSFVFGKVLPFWGAVPPPELLIGRAQAIWGPLAICDYGDTVCEYVAARFDQRLPIGANLAFSRRALVDIGGWRTDLGKVNNTLISGEDHEIFQRIRRSGQYAGYYDPQITVRHYVPPSRLTRRYFRQWFFWHGKTQALMLADLFPQLDLAKVPVVAGVPRFLYRQWLDQCRRYIRALVREDALGRLIEELSLIRYLGLFLERWRGGMWRSRPREFDSRPPLPGISLTPR